MPNIIQRISWNEWAISCSIYVKELRFWQLAEQKLAGNYKHVICVKVKKLVRKINFHRNWNENPIFFSRDMDAF